MVLIVEKQRHKVEATVRMAGAELFFKAETFQRMGAFKFRGAYNALSQFTPAQRKMIYTDTAKSLFKLRADAAAPRF